MWARGMQNIIRSSSNLLKLAVSNSFQVSQLFLRILRAFLKKSIQKLARLELDEPPTNFIHLCHRFC